ncbi:MAG: UDP-3-O-acyl-N-acetylglucosamine deacetylase [Planctomycetota bacterium]
MERKQTTIATVVHLAGKGLHTGARTTMTLRPAPADTGVVLHVAAEDGPVHIPVNSKTCRAGLHRTMASCNGTEVHTVEHLLAAFLGTGVDNVHVDLTAPEPPCVDGSARAFVELVEKAGVVGLEAPIRRHVLKEPITVSDGRGAFITAVPHARGLKLSYLVHYPESRLAQGFFEAEIRPERFASDIAPARTFCLEQHIDAMRRAGCGQGADTQNTLILRENEVVENTLRFEDECARHKLLDLLGDIAVLGRPMAMHVMAFRSGHALNSTFVQEVERAMRKEAHPKGVMDIREIEATLPHRYPFLLVDRILEIEDCKRVVGLKNVTRNEPFFDGHFPGQPVMPGVLQVEAMAQTAGVMMLRSAPNDGTKRLAVLMSIDDVKFRRPVMPGDQLIMEVVMERLRGRVGQVKAEARVGGAVTTEARIKFTLVDAANYV